MNTVPPTATANVPAGVARWHRPPFIGLLALFVAFLGTPLTHSLSMLAGRIAGPGGRFWVLFSIGCLALVLLLVAVRSKRESTGTVLGYLSAMLMWTGWAAYAFKFNEISLQLPMAEIDGSRRPMNLLFIQGSIGICIAVLLYFVFDKDTKCNAFRWLQRVLRLNLGRPESGHERNFGRITFLETLTVLWFCYGVSLFLGDPRYLGYHHPVTYAVIGGLAVWGGYLLWRLLHYTRVMAGIRYAIPTKAILWIPFGEFLPRWGFYHEFWMEPWNYGTEIMLTLAIFVGLGMLTVIVPQRRSTAKRNG
ncbi:MAG: hypothetical protein R3E75_11105 [Steroidobacteraceae bacterium]|nr:hypothetical protein [Nevskiaceae bacterium]MCP5339692.1 hypothetical protein [Nevskiaceae bacterium]MCP5360631.1 hypothetical protein [Nevskiaceae bacterium]